MSFQVPGANAPDIELCQYGQSKLLFRGPKRGLDAPYLAFLGSSETYGRFVDDPFVSLVETALAQRCINLGSANGGLDTIVMDPELLRMAKRAVATVVQVPGAQTVSNRFYRVHPRRNDRVIDVSDELTRLYPELDFTAFTFVRHLLANLADVSDKRFAQVQSELQFVWTQRMHHLVKRLQSRVLFLWLRYDRGADYGADPMLVTRQMLSEVADATLGVVEFGVLGARDAQELSLMQFGELQQPIAENLIGPMTHRLISEKLVAVLSRQ